MTSLHPDERFTLVTLRDTVANLREHIACEAAELAAPRITAAEEDASARVAAAEQERDEWRQRFEDLREEVCRQRSAWERQRDRLRAEVEQLRAEVAAARHRGPESHGETRTHPNSSPYTPDPPPTALHDPHSHAHGPTRRAPRRRYAHLSAPPA